MIPLDVQTKQSLISLASKSREELDTIQENALVSFNSMLSGQEGYDEESAISSLVKSALRVDANPECLKEFLQSLPLRLDEIVSWYELNREPVRQLLLKQHLDNSSIPRYSDIDWRIESGVGSKDLSNQIDLRILARLRLRSVNGDLTKVVSLDLANLNHLKGVLEEALLESRSLRVQKILRQKNKS